MSTGYAIAIHAVPFFDLLDREVESLAEAVFGSDEDRASAEAIGDDEAEATPADARQIASAMDTSRRHLAQGIEAFVRGLPAAVRTDTNVARSAAYALVGLADERMLHYPAGELPGWRDRLLESELYGSALAGQEIIRQAQLAAQGGDLGEMLAPLYLAVLREGFEGSLRTDVMGLTTLSSTLEDTVGALRRVAYDMASDAGPRRMGVPANFLAAGGIALWLASGFALWWALAGGTLDDADRLTLQLRAGAAASFEADDIRSINPSRLSADPDDEFNIGN